MLVWLTESVVHSLCAMAFWFIPPCSIPLGSLSPQQVWRSCFLVGGFIKLNSDPHTAMQQLPLAHLSRRTLPPEEPEAIFPARQFWFDSQTNLVWWDLELFLQFLRIKADRTARRSEWLQSVEERAADGLRLHHGQSPAVIRGKYLPNPNPTQLEVGAPWLANDNDIMSFELCEHAKQLCGI